LDYKQSTARQKKAIDHLWLNYRPSYGIVGYYKQTAGILNFGKCIQIHHACCRSSRTLAVQDTMIL
ncbi:hypothetical protein J4Q44_G00024260, partial [Coregonus suidteri]